ncbi:MAG: hypothetical protein ABMA15_13155, partial [Vicinamibacterales bacterium]
MTSTAGRTVSVQALSAKEELLLVARASMALVVCVWMYLAFASGIGGPAESEKHLLPFQVLVAERPGEEQRTFRELQEGLSEAEAVRASSGVWPSSDALAKDGIPPFAADPTQPVPYTWALVQSGSFVNYLGIPNGGSAPAWLVLVQEPEPGVPPDQAFEDEEHHRLSTGQMLHVSTWTH